MLTPQEILDKVVHHLKTDGRPSYRYDNKCVHCLYRGPEGARCFVGILIPDEAYSPELEDLGVYEFLVMRSLGVDYQHDPQGSYERFLCLLQSIHDDAVRNNKAALEQGTIKFIDLVRSDLDELAESERLTINWE